MLGSIRETVRKTSVVPLIGSGWYAQYLVHEDDLSAGVVRICRNTDILPNTITAAHPAMWYFRDIVRACAASEGKRVRLVRVPWRVVYGGIKVAETLGLRTGFRSDSVLSLVRQNPDPHFGQLEELGIPLRPFPRN